MSARHRILLFGAQGQVGWELRSALAPLGDIRPLARAAVDLSSRDAVAAAIRDARPTLIVNAAAYTAVDKAEEERALAAAVNADAPGVMAQEARRLGAGLVHYSTDYVFDGSRPIGDGGPAAFYAEDDPTSPVNVYGRTKCDGERAVLAAGAPALIFRTSWVYAARGRNFLRTVLRLAGERDSLSMVADQHGAPTWARAIAQATALAAARWSSGASVDASRGGIYHLTAGGRTTWHGFATAILEIAAAKQGTAYRLAPSGIKAIRSEEYPVPARRPKNSLLSNAKLAEHFGLALAPWQESLSLCLEEA